MARIYFGDVEVLNTKTNTREVLKNQVYREGVGLYNLIYRELILHHINPRDREHFRIVRYRTDTAKHIGDTNSDLVR